jgi:3-methyladenine DNA glycosylase AlkD
MNANLARKELRRYASPAKAAVLSRFFKTAPGEYGEGDIFIGVKVPEIRSVAKEFLGMKTSHILSLLHSGIHEERLLALLILTGQYEKGDAQAKNDIAGTYLKNTARINNWDLVDVSAPGILGDHLLQKDRSLLLDLAASGNLWERRIAIVTTLAFIRKGDLSWTLRIAERLMNDSEDLIHKATGWMLREAGKRDKALLEEFLKKNLKRMPRTMLRYAIEKFPAHLRKKYLSGILVQ